MEVIDKIYTFLKLLIFFLLIRLFRMFRIIVQNYQYSLLWQRQWYPSHSDTRGIREAARDSKTPVFVIGPMSREKRGGLYTAEGVYRANTSEQLGVFGDARVPLFVWLNKILLYEQIAQGNVTNGERKGEERRSSLSFYKVLPKSFSIVSKRKLLETFFSLKGHLKSNLSQTLCISCATKNTIKVIQVCLNVAIA